MHITAWKNGNPLKDWDVGSFGDNQEALHRLEQLLEYLNNHSLSRRYELSELGEPILYPEDEELENGLTQATSTLFDLRRYQIRDN